MPPHLARILTTIVASPYCGESRARNDVVIEVSVRQWPRCDAGLCPSAYVYNLAAAQGEKDTGEWRDSLAEEMTPEQIAEARRLAREWKPKRK